MEKRKKIRDMKIIKATDKDKETLCTMFLGHITAHPEYISHGEIQMGVGKCRVEDGRFVTEPSPAARHYWMKYIDMNLKSSESVVYKAVAEDGETAGFCIATFTEDGASPFGMISDILVREDVRGAGVGSSLLEKGLEWLREHGVDEVYLESGLNNHAAHEYFIHKGFRKVSEIYKLM